VSAFLDDGSCARPAAAAVEGDVVTDSFELRLGS
jgi:hypothetical protein